MYLMRDCKVWSTSFPRGAYLGMRRSLSRVMGRGTLVELAEVGEAADHDDVVEIILVELQVDLAEVTADGDGVRRGLLDRAFEQLPAGGGDEEQVAVMLAEEAFGEGSGFLAVIAGPDTNIEIVAFLIHEKVEDVFAAIPPEDGVLFVFIVGLNGLELHPGIKVLLFSQLFGEQEYFRNIKNGKNFLFIH